MQIVNGVPKSTRITASPAPNRESTAAQLSGRCPIRGTGPYIVTPERIRLFAELTHNDHPIHHHDTVARDYGYPALVAPPTFAALVMVRAQYDAVRVLAPGVRPTALLHTRQTLDIRRLLVAGDIVTTDIRIRALRTTGEYAGVEAQLVFTDHHGEIVQSSSSSLYVCAPAVPAHPVTRPYPLGGVVDRARARTGNRRPLGSAATSPGLPLPRRIFPVDSADMDTYDALGTPDHYRTAAGPEAHGRPPSGMMRLALTAGYLSSCLGDPAAVARYDAEFTHFGGQRGRAVQPVEIAGRMVSVDGTGAGVVELDGRCLDRRLFIHAHAVLRPPAR